MLHTSAHFVVPVLIALSFYRPKWRGSACILLATMVVDLDHLLATPVYDPARCSIGFHPLHTTWAIVAYGGMFLMPLLRRWRMSAFSPADLRIHLIGLGLVLHMLLDWGACLVGRVR